MAITQVDERDTVYELGDAPAFRVFVWREFDPVTGHNDSTVYDLHGMTLEEVVSWARSHRDGNAAVEIFCKFQVEPGRPGIVLLDRWAAG